MGFELLFILLKSTCIGDKEVRSASSNCWWKCVWAHNYCQFPVGYGECCEDESTNLGIFPNENQMIMWYWSTCLSAWKGGYLICLHICMTSLSGRIWFLLGIIVNNQHKTWLYIQWLLRNQAKSEWRVTANATILQAK